MKKIILSVFISMMGLSSFAEKTDSIPAKPEDVKSIDAIIHAVYDVISGPAGTTRNWDRMRTLFTPEAKMIPTGKELTGEAVRKAMTVEEYISGSGPFLEKNGFFETEIGRTVEQYGNIAQVFSTYESRKSAADEKPFMRGINSFQLWNDGQRWWVLNILWESETKDNPIPEKYLNKH